MTATKIHGFRDGEITADAVADGAGVRIMLQGSADSRAMEKISELLSHAHDEAVRRKSAELVVDFRALEFMNSSCFKAFVTWIDRVQGLTEDAQYKIRFLSDNKKHWQHRSLGALSCFAADLIRVETKT
jgi:hypothetical protein